MATKKEKAEENALTAFKNFLVLCRTFFGKEPVENVTALNKDSEFYKTAREIAKEFEMDWNNLSMEDSNEVIIALMDDYYNRANTDDDFNYVISFKVNDKKAPKKAE